MALTSKNRVRETTTTTGTGTVTLLGAVFNHQSFSAIGNGNTCYYTIAHQTSAEWEVGIGTYTSAGTTLSRTTVLASSNVGALVNFSAGTKDVYVTLPAERTPLLNASGYFDDVTTLSVNTRPLAGFGNFAINGCMRVAQRGTVAAVNGTATYGGADRIAVLPNGFTTATGNIAQATASYSATGFAQGVTLTTTGTGAVQFVHRIETLNAKRLSGRTITVSAKVYQDTGGALNCGFVLSKANASDNFSAVTTLVTSGTTSVSSATATNISASYAAGATDCDNGLQVVVTINGVGAVTSKNFQLAELQVEIGSVGTQLEFRPFSDELTLCQRYYEVVSWPYTYFSGHTGVALYFGCTYKSTKRAIPTVVLPSATNAVLNSSGAAVTATTWATSSVNTRCFSVTAGFSSAITGILPNDATVSSEL